MRLSILLLTLAASAISAAERRPLTLEELGGAGVEARPDPLAHPFILRVGVQSIAGDSDLALNDSGYAFSERKGHRQQLEGLLLAQPAPGRPGLLMGVGLSQSYIDLGSDAAVESRHGFVRAGLSVPLNARDDWRVELTGLAGAGKASVGDDVIDTKAQEYGIDLGLAFPLVRSWRIEGLVSGGWYWSRMDQVTIQVNKAGTMLPVDLDLSTDSMTFGIGLAWRP